MSASGATKRTRIEEKKKGNDEYFVATGSHTIMRGGPSIRKRRR